MWKKLNKNVRSTSVFKESSLYTLSATLIEKVVEFMVLKVFESLHDVILLFQVANSGFYDRF